MPLFPSSPSPSMSGAGRLGIHRLKYSFLQTLGPGSAEAKNWLCLVLLRLLLLLLLFFFCSHGGPQGQGRGRGLGGGQEPCVAHWQRTL